jgi:hypothetical protein
MNIVTIRAPVTSILYDTEVSYGRHITAKTPTSNGALVTGGSRGIGA